MSLCQTTLAFSDDEMEILQLFYKEEDLFVSATRIEKPLSQIAENITVVTSEDIELMNAHTLVDVLFNITGVQIDILSTPGFPSSVHIQGAEFRHVLVVIDGIPLNNLTNNVADIGALPVRNIERVEIVKGPASSSWGSSLGGVINIITKSPAETPQVTLSASYGEKDTGDFRAEVSGRNGGLGYYFYAGGLQSGGIRPNTHVSDNSLYARFVFDISEKADAFFTFGYNEGSRGLSEAPQLSVSFDNEYEHIYATLGINARLLDKGELSLSFRTLVQDLEQVTKLLNTGLVLDKADAKDETYGGSVKFIQRHRFNTFVIGFDADNGTLTSNKISNGEQGLDKWAIYANDTIAFKEWSFTPGVRYDHTSTNGDFTSPSLGITFLPHKSTVLRATVARGFSIPPLSATFGTGSLSVPVLVPNPDLDVERVWSYQAGMETSVLKYLRLKASVFRHDVRDAIINEQLSPTSFRAVNRDKIRRQGVEIEIKTIPFHNISLTAGYNYMDIEDGSTGKTVIGLPRYTWDVGVEYRAERLKGILKGHYVRWNNVELQEGKDNTFVWDLNLSSTLYKKDTLEVDMFVTTHNLFNASQYPNSFFKNPRRWVEAGLRIIL
jgi:vitamin B12 transporter